MPSRTAVGKRGAKEAASTISGAYSSYQLSNTPDTTTVPKDIAPFINYVKYDTGTTIDAEQGANTYTCSNSQPCLLFHNGGLLFCRSHSFNGTANTNAISYFFDPDGKVTDGTTNGPGKSVMFFLYYNGRLTTRDKVTSNTQDSSGTYNPNASPTKDPPWFSWD